jgi:anti-sigma factor RsiW
MSAASKHTTDACAWFAASITPFVDGELDPDHGVDMEAHMVACAPCAERVALLRAMRHSLRRTAARRAPADLCARVRVTMAAEKQRTSGPKLVRLHYAVGLAAAAGVAFAMGLQHHMEQRAAMTAEPLAPEAERAGVVNIDALLDELIERHAQPLPPEITDPDQVERFDPWLGVRVQRPAFQPFDVSFKGARLYPVSDHAYAQLRYAMRGDRPVTVYIFNTSVVPMRATRLDRRVMRNHIPLYYGRLRGYSVATVEQAGVGYAFASDLDADDTTKMVMAALPQ